MIVQMLDQLGEYDAQVALLDITRQELIDQVLTPEIKTRLREIDDEFAPKYEGVTAKIVDLKAQIKAEVLRVKASVKGRYYQAVYAKGRKGGWDGDKLDGFAMAHPEILKAKKPDGNPDVSFRKV